MNLFFYQGEVTGGGVDGASAPVVVFAAVVFYGIPHRFDSVVSITLSFGLLGSHIAACSQISLTLN